MTVVADTSVLCYAVLIGCEHLLPALFGSVHIPEAVHAELTARATPQPVRSWAAILPDWLQVAHVEPEPDAMLERLQLGEKEVIVLAERMNAGLVLLDEKRARRVAATRGLRVAGLLGILGSAADQGLVNLPDAVARLRRTNFRASQALLRAFLQRHGRHFP